MMGHCWRIVFCVLLLALTFACRGTGDGDDAGDADTNEDVGVDEDVDVDVDADTDDDTDLGGDSDVDDDTDPVPPVGVGVFLYTGAGGGGPGTDLYVEDVAALFTGSGIDAVVGDALPGSFTDDFRLLILMNPMTDIPATVADAALDLVGRGGRVVIIMEHCKNGCWGNAEADSTLVAHLGGTMVLSGKGGAPLAVTNLVVTPVPPITDGVSEIVVYYSGSVDIGEGVALGSVSGGDVVIGYEPVGRGDLVVVADSSMFGYVMDAGDNEQFILNLAALVE
jgi:hypothetical protein